MLRRRVLSDGDLFLERRDNRGQLIAEVVVPAEIEADALEMLEHLAAKWSAVNADRLPPGVLPFRRILQLEAIPRHSRASRPSRG
jgi:hypothetical protein